MATTTTATTMPPTLPQEDARLEKPAFDTGSDHPEQVQDGSIAELPSSPRVDPRGNPLHPTPTDDPMDPLNWSAWRKNICIAIVMLSYFLFT
jgi:hypothetical protein